MQRLVLATMLVCACTTPPSPPVASTPATASAVRFADELSAAVARRDAPHAAALFTEDAVVSWIGVSGETRGRPAIAADFARTLARFDGTTLVIGRIWAARSAAAIELVLRGPKLGVVGAIVIELDDRGLVRALRAYVDVPTIVGQRDPSRLPPRMTVRPPVATPPAGTAVVTARGTADETRNLGLANEMWSALAAHDAARAMRVADPGYQLHDFSAPTALDHAGTQEMVARFLGAVTQFRIAAMPFQLAAGDDVVTEVVEHMHFQDRDVVLHALDVRRFASGKVVAEWQYANGNEVLTELLRMPAAMP